MAPRSEQCVDTTGSRTTSMRTCHIWNARRALRKGRGGGVQPHEPSHAYAPPHSCPNVSKGGAVAGRCTPLARPRCLSRPWLFAARSGSLTRSRRQIRELVGVAWARSWYAEES
jgi:hypothetical protein